METPVSETATAHKSLLHQMTQTTETCLWNDSSCVDELSSSIGHGAVGATCNPVIVVEVLKKEQSFWREHVQQLIRAMPTATEHDISWKVVEEMTIRGAELLKPVFDAQGGRNGRLSVQTDPRYYRDSDAIVRQAVHFATLAPNIIVKIPVTRAGITAIEETTYRGISINATVCFTLPQCVAVAEAVERGLTRREREGKEIASMGPVCTIMVGRLDDWLKVYADRHDISVDPGVLEWAGVAVFKKTYQLFHERRYRIRLLSAAFRNHMHWSELIGGDVVISPPWKWQQRFNASEVPVEPRIDTPVSPQILRALSRFPDFQRAYNEDGLTHEQFDDFPPTRRTLRQFIASCHELDAYVRDLMIPNPDA
jgi:transaldolase